MHANKQNKTIYNERKQLRNMKLVFILCAVLAIFLLYMLVADFFHI